MDELVIKEHDFQAAKSKIQDYVKTAPKDVALPRVREDGGFLNWGDHKVTGTEFNQCIGQVQTSLIALNSSTKAVISEFKEVYKAFEALDKDYIGGIVISVNAAAKASEEAKKASDDISKTIKALKAAVEKIKNFQEEVRGDILSLKAKVKLKGDVIKHLDDVDTIWDDVQAQQEILIGFENQLNGIQSALSSIDSFKTNLNKLNHLVDIDSLWDGLYKHYKDYEKFYNRFVAFSSDSDGKFQAQKDDYCRLSKEHKKASDAFKSYSQKVDSTIESVLSDLKELSNYTEKLQSLSHIEDVDKTWETLYTHLNSYDAFCQAIRQFESSTSGQISDNTKLISNLQTSYDTFHGEYNDYCIKSKEKVNGLSQALYSIDQFIGKLKSISHLEDIDQTWSELKKHYDSYNAFYQETQKSQLNTAERIEEDEKLVSKLQIDFESFRAAYQIYCERTKEEVDGLHQTAIAINQYLDKLKSFAHLSDIDSIWQDMEALKQEYSELRNDINDFDEKTNKIIGEISEDVSALKAYKLQLEGLNYLPKIDELWDFSHALSERTDEISDIVAKHSCDINTINSNIVDLDSKYKSESERLSHRIRVNHIIAAATFVLVLTLFLLNLLNIL